MLKFYKLVCVQLVVISCFCCMDLNGLDTHRKNDEIADRFLCAITKLDKRSSYFEASSFYGGYASCRIRAGRGIGDAIELLSKSEISDKYKLFVSYNMFIDYSDKQVVCNELRKYMDKLTEKLLQKYVLKHAMLSVGAKISVEKLVFCLVSTEKCKTIDIKLLLRAAMSIKLSDLLFYEQFVVPVLKEKGAEED